MASGNRCAVSVVCRDTNVCNGSKQTVRAHVSMFLFLSIFDLCLFCIVW